MKTGLLLFLFLLTAVFPVKAGNLIVVNTGSDEDNSNGNCSLREAIHAANNDAPRDGCPAGNGADSILLTQTVILSSSLPALTEGVTIAGNDDFDTFFITGVNQNLLIFHLDSPGNNQTYSIKGLRLTGTRPDAGPGAILVDEGETLNLSYCYIDDHKPSAAGGPGGAIHVEDGGHVWIHKCTLENNRAQHPRGGGALSVRNGTASITNSTLFDNESGTSGGAVSVGVNSTLTATNSTFSDNRSDTNGGAFYVFNESTVTLNSVTITLNRADDGASGAGNGGGIFVADSFGDNSIVNIVNSIVADNTDATPSPNQFSDFPDVRGTFNSNGYNLIGVDNLVSGFNEPGDITGAFLSPLDPRLQPLAENGDATMTHKLGDVFDGGDSPAMHAGDCTAAGISYDQRGYQRDVFDTCDIGAFECDAIISTTSCQTSAPGVLLDAKVFLAGPYENGLMKSPPNLLSEWPQGQPYNTAPWNYAGGEWVSTMPPGTIDWVLVSIGTSPFRSDVVATRAALLRFDGTLTYLDGYQPLVFDGVLPTIASYYVFIEHRNHLAVRSALKVGLDQYEVTTFDFRTAATQATGTDALQDLGDGNFGLWAGDGNADGKVEYIGSERDQLTIINALGTTNLAGSLVGYMGADMNLDGKVEYIGSERDQLTIINTLGTTNLAGSRAEQVPD